MQRTVIFRNMDTGQQLTMPVTPPEFDVYGGRAVQPLDMAGFGQVNVPGLKTLFDRDQEFLLPAHNAPYCTSWQSPYAIVSTLLAWSEAANVVRYIVYGTIVNAPCLIETVRYREQDGTNDVYLTLSLKQYRYLAAEAIVDNPGGNDARDPDGENALNTAQGADKLYTIEGGDCLIAIAEKYYGDASLAYKLATYNGIANPNLIYTGDTLKLPPKETLAALSPTYGPAPAEDFGERAAGGASAVVTKWLERMW